MPFVHYRRLIAVTSQKIINMMTKSIHAGPAKTKLSRLLKKLIVTYSTRQEHKKIFTPPTLLLKILLPLDLCFRMLTHLLCLHSAVTWTTIMAWLENRIFTGIEDKKQKGISLTNSNWYDVLFVIFSNIDVLPNSIYLGAFKRIEKCCISCNLLWKIVLSRNTENSTMICRSVICVSDRCSRCRLICNSWPSTRR